MPKSRTFQVNEGRMFFKCPFCQFRKVMGVASGLRRKSICCQRCNEKTFCVLDRRRLDRTKQSGRVLLLVSNTTAEFDLLDVSTNGVGLEINIRSGLKISVGQEIRLKCSWNPHLFGQERYIIKSVRGLRIGLERRH